MRLDRLKRKFTRFYSSATEFVVKNRYYFIAGYIAASVALFLVQFYLLRNWDMVARVLNGNYLLHNGFYFEPEREFLESFLMGLLAFPLGSYAVYGFIAAGVGIFAYAIMRFSRAFSLEPLVLFLLFFNPFFLYYGASNGSEMFVISFLLLTFAEIKRKSYWAGLFLALAFVSEYYALLFIVLFAYFFFKERPVAAVKKAAVNVLIFLAALIPYFLYNLINYGNVLYTFALTYLYEAIEVGNLPYFVYSGLLALAIPAGILLFAFFTRKHRGIKLRRERLTDLSMFALAVAIGLYIYYSANGFMLNGLDAGRFVLPALCFSLPIVAVFMRKADLPWLLVFSAVSFAIVIVAIQGAYLQTAPAISEVQSSVSAFGSIYGTTNCTVYSDEWVYLDYYGLPAAPIPRFIPAYSGNPIVNLGPINTTYPLLYSFKDVYIYGNDSYCAFQKVNDNILTLVDPVLLHENASQIPNDPCMWLFGMQPNIPLLKNGCEYFSSLLANGT